MEFKITLADIYGTNTPKVPDGYEIAEFRYPEPQDTYLNWRGFREDTYAYKFDGGLWPTGYGPRAILRVKPKPRVFTDKERLNYMLYYYGRTIEGIEDDIQYGLKHYPKDMERILKGESL